MTNETTSPAIDDIAVRSEAHVSGPIMTRVAGLPSDVCDLVDARTSALLEELAVTQGVLSTQRSSVIDTCFGLVPRVPSTRTRRRVLAGKRAANKLGALGWDAHVWAEVKETLGTIGETDYARLTGWNELTVARDDLLAELAHVVEKDRDHAFNTLRTALEEPGFRDSLPIVAPDWVRYGALSKDKSETARDLKTLYSYVSRAAVKTSPMSGLTTVGVAGRNGLGRSVSRASVTLAYFALQRLTRSPHTAALVNYRTAPWRAGGPAGAQGLSLHSEVLANDGVVWRQDRVVEADHMLPWLNLFPEAEGLAFSVILERIGGEKPFLRFLRLLDSGILIPVPPWRRGEDPLPVLGALVADTPASPVSATELFEVHALGRSAAEEDHDRRLTTALRVREVTGSWKSHGSERDRAPSGVIYEDRETDLDLPDPSAIPEVRADLASLTARMRPHIFRSHIYDLVLERFTAEFGVGGVCEDVLGFLMRLSLDGDSNPPLERAFAADTEYRTSLGERAWLPVGPSSAPPAASVLFQTEAEDMASLRQGHYRMVVNQFSAGTGGFFSRFRGLLGPKFTNRLVTHLDECWEGVRLHELVAWTECNTVQASCSNLLPALALHGETESPDRLAMEEMRLVHDATSDTLSLTDTSDDLVGLTYLGLIPSHLLQSYVYLLAILADPWINASPLSDYTFAPAYVPHFGTEITPLPRVQEGRVVTRRASWVVPVGLLPEYKGDPVTWLIEVDAFRRDHGIPEEVFVHQFNRTSSFAQGERKPLWACLSSALSIDVLRQWLSQDTTHLRIVEALPARGAHPQRDVRGRKRATEHAVLVHWDRTKGQAL